MNDKEIAIDGADVGNPSITMKLYINLEAIIKKRCKGVEQDAALRDLKLLNLHLSASFLGWMLSRPRAAKASRGYSPELVSEIAELCSHKDWNGKPFSSEW